MNDEQRYLFDLNGYLVLKGVLSPERVAACNRALDRLATIPKNELPEPVIKTPSHEDDLDLSNVLEADEAFYPLVDIPEVIDVIAEVSGQSFRLNHTYAHCRTGAGRYTFLHCAGTPIMDKCQYRCQNGQIISTLTKAVFPLLNAAAEDGCFAVIPGSHKSNFARPYGAHPDKNPPLIPVPAERGDCIIFTEALTHGSMVNTSDRLRRTAYYCYSIGWMPDWPGARFSNRIADFLTEQQVEIIRLK